MGMPMGTGAAWGWVGGRSLSWHQDHEEGNTEASNSASVQEKPVRRCSDHFLVRVSANF